MTIARRRLLALAAGALASPALPAPSSAQAYPSHPVRLIVGYPAGSPSDIGARLTAQFLAGKLGQPFVVENVPGAASNIATERVAQASPDGHTLLWVVSANAINATLYKSLNFNFLRDIAPVCGLARFPLIMEVAPDFPAKTVADFIAMAKARPGALNMASSGIGSAQHIAGEMFKAATGTDLVHVPYRGAPQAITDLIGGRVQVMFDVWPSSIGQITGGKLRALGVTTAERHPLLPDVPTVGATVAGFETSALQGLGAPAATPPAIVAALNAAMNEALADTAFRARLVELGGLPLPGPASAFRQVMERETTTVGAIITRTGMTVD